MLKQPIIVDIVNNVALQHGNISIYIQVALNVTSVDANNTQYLQVNLNTTAFFIAEDVFKPIRAICHPFTYNFKPLENMLLCDMRFWLHFKIFEFFMQKTTDSLTRYIQEKISPNFFEGNCAVIGHITATKIVGHPTRLDAAAVYDKKVLRTLATVLRSLSICLTGFPFRYSSKNKEPFFLSKLFPLCHNLRTENKGTTKHYILFNSIIIHVSNAIFILLTLNNESML